ncbi:MAG: hypothetical protein LC777_08355 [Actinobacteria bacterium]|nr:hypothetical protein [Actinomycetota bacterium]
MVIPPAYSKFGLSVEHDEDLSDWMRGRLRLALWPCDDVPDLDCVETGVLEKMQPPRQIAQQPAAPDHLLLATRAAQQLVDQPVAQPLAHLGRQLADRQARPHPIKRVLDELLGELPAQPPGRHTPRRKRAAVIELRSPSRLAPLDDGAALHPFQPGPAVLVSRHETPVRSCLHSCLVLRTSAGG